jgi:esterase/lipase
MRHAMNAFQMGGILILHLANNTIAHSLKNINFISPKGNQFGSNIYIKKTIMFFQNTHNKFS